MLRDSFLHLLAVVLPALLVSLVWLVAVQRINAQPGPESWNYVHPRSGATVPACVETDSNTWTCGSDLHAWSYRDAMMQALGTPTVYTTKPWYERAFAWWWEPGRALFALIALSVLVPILTFGGGPNPPSDWHNYTQVFTSSTPLP